MKEPFDIDEAFVRLREAVKPFPKAGLFELRDDGFDSPFEQLVACILSIRTRDEDAVPAARNLFALARSPEEIAVLEIEQMVPAIAKCSWPESKAAQIRDIARQVQAEFDGELPCDYDTLVSLRGVGPKCAGLTLGIACNQPRIGVDIHVHRVTNRTTRCDTKTPEQTLKFLEGWLPKEYWVEINELMVPFGKHICTGNLPKCSTCPLLSMCPQFEVTKHR
ncbi:MAG TPA: endonuclease III [Abditibacteriaceae bacterium]|jgi:endonuclease-3